MATQKSPPRIQLPGSWPLCVKSAMLHVISLAQYAMVHTRSWAVNSPIARVRLNAHDDRLKQYVAMLEEEIRIKDARMKGIAPNKRPHYSPTERLAVLELRAARVWSLGQTANVFM